MERLVGFLCLAATLCIASWVSAQNANDKAAAEALYQRGVELANAGKYAEACGQFEASQRLDPGLGTMLYLADCYEQVGKTASAWATFHEAESIAQGRGDTERASIAQRRAAALEPKLAKLWVHVAAGQAEGLEIRRNGSVIPRQSWGIGLPVDTGEHRIEASAPGKQAWLTQVTVSGDGATTKVEIPLLQDAPEAAAAPAAAPAETDSTAPPPPAPMDEGPNLGARGDRQRIAAFTAGGVGLAGLVLGAVFGFQAKARFDDSKQDCDTDNINLCGPDGVRLREDAQKAATISTVGLAVGGAALATGIVLYLTAPKADSAASLQLHTAVDSSSGGLKLRGTW